MGRWEGLCVGRGRRKRGGEVESVLVGEMGGWGRRDRVAVVEGIAFRDESGWVRSASHRWELNHLAALVDLGIESHQYHSWCHSCSLSLESSCVQLHTSTVQRRGRNRPGR